MTCINPLDLMEQNGCTSTVKFCLKSRIEKKREIKRPNLAKMKSKIAVTVENAHVGMRVINQHNYKEVGIIDSIIETGKAFVRYERAITLECIGHKGQFNLLIYIEKNDKHGSIKVQRRNLKVKGTIRRGGVSLSCRTSRAKCQRSNQ